MPTLRRSLALLLLLSFILSACASPSAPMPVTVTSTDSPPTSVPVNAAFETGVYPNLFRDYLGKNDEEIQAKIDSAWDQLFYGDDVSERVYYPVGSDMAYISDIANEDVRTEGMSYGMMIAVQLNKKEEFDRLWKWTRTYMYQKDGGYKGYFAWHCKTDGTQLAANPAADGEEWFIMALMFADGRWGSGEGIYNYRAEAQSILDVALHADKLGGDLSTNLFDPATKQVVFVPQLGNNSQFTDPSYHLPHYYQLWSLWADKDNEFWAEAAQISRAYLKTTVHPQTGLAPNYSYFDGKPYNDEYNGNFRYDTFRVGANVGVDYAWFAADPWQVEQSNRLLDFFASQGINEYKAEYLLTGEPQVTHRSSGLIATNAVAALAADREKGEPFVQALWDQELPTGKYRYYDGLLMMLGLLQVSGNFRIYEPGAAPAGQIFPTPKPEITGKFTPPVGQALLIVGQTAADINSYFDATVTAPGGMAVDASLKAKTWDTLTELANKYPKSVLAVGLDLSDSLDEIVAGTADEKINTFVHVLASYQRPVFLRLSYRSDNSPDEYISAWKQFHEQIQAKAGRNVALVWEVAACDEADIPAWYPGDEYVDWVGISNCDGKPVALQFAREHFKPAMLIASPTDSANWTEWFVSFVQFVKDNNEVLRAVTYIHSGTGQIDSNVDSLKQWKDETRQSFWLRAGPSLFEALGFAE